jgi:hypothetical protein
MELLNFTTNSQRNGHDLKQSQTTYDFEDIQIKLDTEEEITVEGYIDLDFDIDSDGYYIDICEVTILTIWDRENEPINLSKEIANQIKHEMQNDLDTCTIESH